ncbi:hypothetical protein DH2020_047363 [Rehmannia glutinosa]|uniref:Uncharacterized protein n=1 Tax=Rehmannia glutinosa TaxID=99300 RepID=A0ABR0U8T6_REHGL
MTSMTSALSMDSTWGSPCGPSVAPATASLAVVRRILMRSVLRSCRWSAAAAAARWWLVRAHVWRSTRQSIVAPGTTRALRHAMQRRTRSCSRTRARKRVVIRAMMKTVYSLALNSIGEKQSKYLLLLSVFKNLMKKRAVLSVLRGIRWNRIFAPFESKAMCVSSSSGELGNDMGRGKCTVTWLGTSVEFLTNEGEEQMCLLSPVSTIQLSLPSS